MVLPAAGRPIADAGSATGTGRAGRIPTRPGLLNRPSRRPRAARAGRHDFKVTRTAPARRKHRPPPLAGCVFGQDRLASRQPLHPPACGRYPPAQPGRANPPPTGRSADTSCARPKWSQAWTSRLSPGLVRAPSRSGLQRISALGSQVISPGKIIMRASASACIATKGPTER